MSTLIMQIVRMKFVYGASEYGVKVPGFVAKGNIFGAQFHPEKSGEIGMRMLKNFKGVG